MTSRILVGLLFLVSCSHVPKLPETFRLVAQSLDNGCDWLFSVSFAYTLSSDGSISDSKLLDVSDCSNNPVLLTLPPDWVATAEQLLRAGQLPHPRVMYEEPGPGIAMFLYSSSEPDLVITNISMEPAGTRLHGALVP